MEDRNITISGHLITAALQMLSILCAAAVFIMDKRAVGALFYIITGLSFFSFIFSIYFGAKGIGNNKQNDSELSTTAINPFFNRQAITSIIGILFFSLSVFIGVKRSDYTKTSEKEPNQRNYNSFKSSNSEPKDIEQAEESIRKLSLQLNALKKEMAEINKMTTNK